MPMCDKKVLIQLIVSEPPPCNASESILATMLQSTGEKSKEKLSTWFQILMIMLQILAMS
jgi:hypothetical protein